MELTYILCCSFLKDVRARKRLAELLFVEPDVRLAIINAVLRDVVTKQDLAELWRAIRGLEARLNSLRLRWVVWRLGCWGLDRLFKLVIVSVLGIRYR